MSFQRVISNALDSIRKIAGVPIAYQRDLQSVGLMATPANTLVAADENYDVETRKTTRDFIIAARELKLGGQVVLPQRQDRILEKVDGKVHTYEVHAPSGQQPWSYVGSARSDIRVTTILKDVA